MKKIVVIILSITFPLILLIGVVLISCLLVLDFFGTNTTDGYVVDNMPYASDYRQVLNSNIQNGYVSLERILYFYLANDTFTFEQIYNDNLDLETKKMKPITEVCSMEKYKNLSVCSIEEISRSNQIDDYQAKPFNVPIDFSQVTITSIFMEQRVVFNEYNVHKGWDLASTEKTEVKSVCDGTITKVAFPYTENLTNVNGGLGNNIILKCNVDGNIYNVIYGHLYPSSALVNVNDSVTKGQVIARVGTTGYSTGNHLHYEVQNENGVNIDGMSLIDFTTNSNIENLQKPNLLLTP